MNKEMTLTTRQDQDDRQDKNDRQGGNSDQKMGTMTGMKKMIPTVMNIKIEEINKKMICTTRPIKMFDKTKIMDKNIKLQ